MPALMLDLGKQGPVYYKVTFSRTLFSSLNHSKYMTQVFMPALILDIGGSVQSINKVSVC